MPNLIGQEYFDCFLDGVSIRGVGFGQVVAGDQQVDEHKWHFDAEML